MRLFFSTKSDPRKLSHEWHRIAKQNASRREHIHGKLHEQHCKCRKCKAVAA